MSRHPIGTRIRLIGSDTRSGIKGKIATIVTPSDIRASWPDASLRTTIRMDEIGDGSLYFTLNAGDEDVEFIEGPALSTRCLIKKKELDAHADAIERLVHAAKNGDDNDSNLWKEKLRNADSAVGKIIKMLLDQRGICKE